MGVTGLWRLVEPTGKTVPVEALENKVLAVDISIWLHQVVKGYQDAKGAPLANAHLMGLFQRLCKLLYFRIKPVFVFDGAFPELKKETIAKRQDNKSRYHSESERLKREIALLLSKRTAIGSILGKQISPKKQATRANDDDLFKLPALPERKDESESESDEEDKSSGSIVDLHSVDLESDNFKQLPVKEKYDVLMDLKETRKMNSWGRLHELPKQSDNFSDFQMGRLLKRRKVQECIEETEKEMGSTGMSLNDLEMLLNEEGIDTKIESIPTRRIASNVTTRFLLINNVKKTLAEAKEKKDKDINEKQIPGPCFSVSKVEEEIRELNTPSKDELEDDLQKAIQMSLECMDEPGPSKDEPGTSKDEPNTSIATNKTDGSWTSFLSDSDYSNNETDSEENDGFADIDMTTAKSYIMQYTDFTNKAINKLVSKKSSNDTNKLMPVNVDQIIEELSTKKPMITDYVDLSSDNEPMFNCRDSDKLITKSERISDEGSDSFKANEKQESLSEDIEILKTQNSITCIDDTQKEVIFLDTSTEDIKEAKPNEEKNMKLNIDCTSKAEISDKVETDISTDDDDFEEVPTLENDSTSKPVIELVLDVEKEPDDDIFADVFAQACAKPLNTFKVEPTVAEDKYSNTEGLDIIETKEVKIISDSTEIIGDKQELKSDLQSVSKLNTMESDETDKTSIVELIKNVASRQDDLQELEPEELEVTNIIQSRQSDVEPARIQLPKEISAETLNNMVLEMQNEERNLIQEKGRLDRVGRNITQQMTQEAQELLQLFGIPYIVAPMEAEAQCAFLESVNLTDGTITDDSDIWLFGGRTVYKNFFNQKKHVLQFLSERIEKTFNLPREQLILLALLVGSDYTTGLSGVGPVTALEILASFPYNKKQLLNETLQQAKYSHMVAGLQDFKKWVRSGKRTDNTTLKKKLRNVEVTDDFPSTRVVQAYLEPNVEKSEDTFTWGQPDVTIIRDYTKQKFGWSQNKVDEILQPVLKRMQDRQTQKTLQDYFKRKIDFDSLEDQLSKRVKAAVQKMGPEGCLAVQEVAEQPKPKAVRKRKMATSQNKPGQNDRGEGTSKDTETVPSKPKRIPKLKGEGITSSSIVKVQTVNEKEESKSVVEINVRKMEKFQEIIPQREKDKQKLFETKMKAIEVFRKTKLDSKRQVRKKRANLPKEKAELSESDSD